MADDVTHYDTVEGYCGRLSYGAGETVDLHINCRSDRYDVEIHRWGATRELVWSTSAVSGVEHPTPADADSHGCGWPVSLEVPVDGGWRSGMYHVTLTASEGPPDRRVGHAMFVVRAAVPQSAAVVVIATNTYNAYNNWGGRSLYTGGQRVSFDRPFGRGMIMRPHTERDDRKSPPRRAGEQPDVDGEVYQQYRYALGYPGYMSSAGWFTYERRFAEWAEGAGLQFDYAVSSDLHRASTLDGYSVVLSVGHDEYWSLPQRAELERFVAAGGNVASFSGNTMFWQVRLEDDGRSMVCHKYGAHLTDPVMGTPDQHTMTGMWADPVVGRPETALLGAGSAHGLYSRFGASMPRGSGGFTVYRDDHWMFADTGLRYGDVLGNDHGVVGYETVGCRLTFDDYQLPVAAGGDGTPADIEVVAFTPSSNLAMGDYPASIAALDDQGDLEFVAERLYGNTDADTLARCRYGNSVMLTCRPYGAFGGEVATVGSTDWVYGLADPLVAQVTTNIVTRLATP